MRKQNFRLRPIADVPHASKLIRSHIAREYMMRIGPALMIGFAAIATAAPLHSRTPSRTEQLEDLRFFRTEVLEKDRSFSVAARAKAVAMLAHLRSSAGRLSRAQLALQLGAVTALAQNGHTELKTGPLRAMMNRSPVQYVVGSDGVFIAASSDPRVPIGARVERIGRWSIERIKGELGKYAAGNGGHREWMLYTVLESPELLHAMGATRGPDRVLLRLKGGKSVTLSALAPEAAAAEALWGDREINFAGRLGGPVPLYLKEPTRGYRLELLSDSKAVYLAFRQNHDDESGEPISQFAAAAAATIQQREPCFVVVDERLNYGGDLNATRDLMMNIPQLIGVGGHIYAITSGKTFSSGISSLGYLKQAAGKQLTIVGLPVGDDLDFWAEGDHVTLPNSRLMFGFATERHVNNGQCTGAHCHAPVVEHPIRVSSLAPDVPVPFTFESYARGHDPALDFIRRDMAARASRCRSSADAT